MSEYDTYLDQKLLRVPPTGLDQVPVLAEHLFDFQRDIIAWALRRGRACVFADCGLGKTLIELEWATHIPGPVLILAPLAVTKQMEREAERFGVDGVTVAKREPSTTSKITITNYERLHHFTPNRYHGVILDESSILKGYDRKTKTQIIESFLQTPFKLACTATPAPNDHMELATHAEFMGVMTRAEMLSMFFVHDGGSTQNWRLKGHAQERFWEWVTEWAIMLRKPSDLAYHDDGFILPPLEIHNHIVRQQSTPDGYLFPVEAVTLQERLIARRESVDERVEAVAQLVNDSSESWVVWCNLNAESTALAKAIPDAKEVRGSDSATAKEAALLGFTDGKHRVLVTKPSIAGHGMNWQHCAHQAFVGLSDSWEAWYQAVRRSWRFGQTRPVNVYVVSADTEGRVVANIKRKERQAAELFDAMVSRTHRLTEEHLRGLERYEMTYERDITSGDGWTLHLGDCVDVLREMDEASVDYIVYSPPFASLYTYSNSLRDMGNVRDIEEFTQHFGFAVSELFRVLQPGRLMSVHCMNLPTSKYRDGHIGLRDFRGELIEMFTRAGFIYHSEVVIWKDPVTAMQRTKALGLLYKQLKKDSAMSRQGIPDYLVTMRKPGENGKPISHTPDQFPLPVWQRYASPIWMDINMSDTLQYASAREDKDERHIAPLQLEVVRRAVRMWSAEGDTVLSPFAGIGTEGYVAIEEGRQFIGIELKRSYYEQAVRNIASAVRHDLFSQAAV
jgi:DNA modification methylase